MWPRTPIGKPPLPALRTSTVTFSPFAPGANLVASCPRPKPPHPRPRAGSPTLTNPSKRKPTQANFGPTNSPGENSGQRRKQIERPQNKPQLSTVRGAKHRRQITGPLVRQPAPAARLARSSTTLRWTCGILLPSKTRRRCGKKPAPSPQGSSPPAQRPNCLVRLPRASSPRVFLLSELPKTNPACL